MSVHVYRQPGPHVITATEAEAMGAREWIKGTKHRLYLTLRPFYLEAYAGIRINGGKATVWGEPIPVTQARQYVTVYGQARLYIDMTADRGRGLMTWDTTLPAEVRDAITAGMRDHMLRTSRP